MEYRYSRESLKQSKRAMWDRGLRYLFISAGCLGFLLLPFAWYFCLTPSLIYLYLGVMEIKDSFGDVEELYESLRIVTTDEGIEIYTSPDRRPFKMIWENMTIMEEIVEEGVLKRFVVNTGVKYWKTYEFDNKIEAFSDLYRNVCAKVKT
ncbi:hypothetical protein [Microbulbifer sediminum]|uniref:hypothetical protein n=1 Tax=Microbulbifer sediminum TaxID=2904250 RepID=UPI001F2049B9|nr:hypothetical protein [Microbulbifer sediminum]